VLLMLERLIEYISKHQGVEWLPFEDIARDFRARYPFAGAARPPVI
jgi:peptidoglycan-N-acetylglucosamine deacetylase